MLQLGEELAANWFIQGKCMQQRSVEEKSNIPNGTDWCQGTDGLLLPSEGQLEGGRKTQVVKVRVDDRKILTGAMQA